MSHFLGFSLHQFLLCVALESSYEFWLTSWKLRCFCAQNSVNSFVNVSGFSSVCCSCENDYHQLVLHAHDAYISLFSSKVKISCIFHVFHALSSLCIFLFFIYSTHFQSPSGHLPYLGFFSSTLHSNSTLCAFLSDLSIWCENCSRLMHCWSFWW